MAAKLIDLPCTALRTGWMVLGALGVRRFARRKLASYLARNDTLSDLMDQEDQDDDDDRQMLIRNNSNNNSNLLVTPRNNVNSVLPRSINKSSQSRINFDASASLRTSTLIGGEFNAGVNVNKR
jgi:hypothetical protein